MNARPTSSFIKLFLIVALAICALFLSHHALAGPIQPILWTGPNTNFDQHNAPEDDVLDGSVSLTRDSNECLYNSVTESGATLGSPADTEWAFDPGGNITDATNNSKHLSYQALYAYRNGDLAGLICPNQPSPGPFMIVHLINENIYFGLNFTDWGQHGAGFFAYTRSTPAAVAPPPPTPSVGITNPVNNATFAAPANVKLLAGAAVSSGVVSNVSFFNNGSLVGSDIAPPFTNTINSLGAGSYALTAVATAAGVSATSSVVNISVVTPVTTSLTSPSAVNNNNQFAFNYSVNQGLSYVVESSSNLINWTPLVTNVASVNPASFTTNIVDGDTYYRVGRLPNP